MISPRVLAVLSVVLAVCAALPAQTEVSEKPNYPRPVTSITDDDLGDDTPWFSFPLFGNLFAPLWRLFPSFTDIGPRIIANDDKFQVIVNVKDYKKEDLKVKVKNAFIFVQGSHEGKQDDHDVFASQFFHTYSLPANCSGADVTADLSSDGYLVVTAPLSGPVDRSKETEREVPINETGAPYQPPKEEKVEKITPAAGTSSPAPVSEGVDDRKEPTTPSDREVTEKDKDVAHENEISNL